LLRVSQLVEEATKTGIVIVVSNGKRSVAMDGEAKYNTIITGDTTSWAIKDHKAEL
jgi:hypothetical protein